ncbi:MAG: hypothetical protein Q8Q89_03980 [bacterium]|nr:hypothetical protein [bacterium]
MKFEVHITVDSQDFNRWKELCVKLGLNPLWIKNSKGWYDQQMLCAVDYNGSFLRVHNFRRELSRQIRDANFKVIREKVECQFRKWPSSLYNECHIKIRLPDSENETVVVFCEANDISSSWSLVHDVSGERKWYLTVRDYGLEARKASLKFTKAIRAVHDRFGKPNGIEIETAIFDTNKDIDRGWC